MSKVIFGIVRGLLSTSGLLGGILDLKGPVSGELSHLLELLGSKHLFPEPALLFKGLFGGSPRK